MAVCWLCNTPLHVGAKYCHECLGVWRKTRSDAHAGVAAAADATNAGAADATYAGVAAATVTIDVNAIRGSSGGRMNAVR